MKRGRSRRRQPVAELSQADRRYTWTRFLKGVVAPEISDLERLVELSGGWRAPDIATSVGLAVAYKLLGDAQSDQRTLENLVLRENHTEAPEQVAKSILRHAAIHEAGHAVWAAHAWGPESVRAVTLVGPPPTLGQTLLAEWVFSRSRDGDERRRLVGMAIAGAVGEQLAFGPDHPSIGGDHDLERGWELLNERGVPERDRGQAGLAARWVNVQSVLEHNKSHVMDLAERLLSDREKVLMSPELQELLVHIGGDRGESLDMHIESAATEPLLLSSSEARGFSR